MIFDFDDIFEKAVADELASHDSRETEETIEIWHERIMRDYDLLLIYEVALEKHSYDKFFGKRPKRKEYCFYDSAVRDIKMLNAAFNVSDVRYFVTPGAGNNSFIGRRLVYDDKFLPKYLNVKSNTLYIMCGLSNRRTTLSKAMYVIGLMSQRIHVDYKMTTYLLKKVIEEESNDNGTISHTTYDLYFALVPELITLSERTLNAPDA